jgi:hypothetical protein
VRKAMTKLSFQWRKKHLIKANEEDLITMDPPKKHVNLYDWKERRIYAFEASTILRCITKRLTFHDGMFATPLQPVNPYTNMTLTLGQLHSVTEQLRAHGLTHWSLEAFRNARYCWTDYTIINDNALQIHAMNHVFADLKNTELHDTLIDFIEAEYTMNEIIVDKSMYIWLITNAMESDHMCQWRKICYQFYKNQIIYKDIPVKQRIAQISISATATTLCRVPRELYRMRNRMAAIMITGSDST